MKTRNLCLCLLLALCALAAADPVCGQEATAKPAPRVRYVEFEIRGAVPETQPPIYLMDPAPETLYQVLERIERAREDAAVHGVVVRLHSPAVGWARAQELREAFLECRRAGKDVICVLYGADNLSYYLATGAARIVTVPTGLLMVSGLRAEAVFAKGLLDKIGVKAELVQVGRYKGAGEMVARSGFSPAFREALQSIIDDYYRQLRDGIAEGRELPISRAEVLLRRGPYTARAALRAGLVDDVLFYDELVEDLRGRHGERLEVDARYGLPPAGRQARPEGTSLFEMVLGLKRPEPRAPTRPAIAVIYAVGPIVTREPELLDFGEQLVSAEGLVKVIDQAARNDRIRAIVLRVNSPGGSAMASDTIWRHLRLADGRKPVIASLSDTAASGGFYIGAGAREIIAEPGSLTGSIGVMGGKLVVSGLLEKLGVNVEVVESPGATGLFSPFEEFSSAERAKMEQIMRDIYDTFVERVAETRPQMSPVDVARLAEGRVWTGSQARENGLVDALGGLQKAIERAREAAGIAPEQEIEIVRLPRARSLAEMLLFGGEGGVQSGVPRTRALHALPPRVRTYLRALLALREEAGLCLMPALVLVR